MNETWLKALASRYGINVPMMAPLSLNRHNVTVTFPSLRVELRTPRQRHQLFALIMGVRLGVDWGQIDFDPRSEIPRVDIAKKPSEAPSAFGDRLLRLLPKLSVDVAESITQRSMHQREFLHDSLRIVYVSEIGKNLHMLSISDLERLPYDGVRVHTLAKAALFHEQGSYRPQPRVERLRNGRIRTYQSTEGLMASRACLMPDFDLDAAREHGFVTMPSVDTMLVAEPRCTTDREDLRWELLARTIRIWRETKTPFSTLIVDLGLATAECSLESQWSTQHILRMPEFHVTGGTVEASQ